MRSKEAKPTLDESTLAGLVRENGFDFLRGDEEGIGRVVAFAIAGKWDDFIFGGFHRSGYAYAIWKTQWMMDDKTYWRILGRAWTACDSNWQYFSYWYVMFASPRPDREYLMSEEDRKTFQSLPETLTIYRGCNSHSKHGLSWTLDKAFAQHFADKRHCFWFTKKMKAKFVKPRVIERVIHKSDAIAYFSTRKESEIVTFKFLKKGSL